MSKFNSSISTVGIKEPKVQQAILKLHENSIYQHNRLSKAAGDLKEEIRLLKQSLSNINVDIDIDEPLALQIVENISEELSTSLAEVRSASAAATSASQKATEKAAQASADAAEVKSALTDIEGAIRDYAEDSVAEGLANAVETATRSATEAAESATSAAENAVKMASQASLSANNAAATAAQATEVATVASNAMSALRFRQLSVPSSINTTYDQYQKIAIFPAVSASYGAFVTLFGSMGGWTNAETQQIYVTIGQRQSDSSTFTDLDVLGYAFRDAVPECADIVLYKESDDTFSLYLKGTINTNFRHNLSMVYDEKVTPVTASSYSTSAPTGTLVWSFIANHKVLATTEDVSKAVENTNHESVSLSHVNIDLAGRAFCMRGLVSDPDATYNVRVTLDSTSYNNYAYINGSRVTLTPREQTSFDFTCKGDGTFTVDNISTYVSVFIRIWR